MGVMAWVVGDEMDIYVGGETERVRIDWSGRGEG